MAACPSNRPVLLVVEDDDILREAVAIVLSCEGYEVVMASSGEEALALIADAPAIDGLYTDIQLTGPLTGWDVGEAFHARWPTKPIAYTSARDWPHARLMPTGQFLRKPFLLQELVSALEGKELPGCGGCRGPEPDEER